MSVHKTVSTDIQNLWNRLSHHWKGELADVFYHQYVVSIVENVETFENVCTVLQEMSLELLKEMQIIEQDLK